MHVVVVVSLSLSLHAQDMTFIADKPVLSCMFSNDSKTIAALSADKSIRLWNVKTAKLIAKYSEQNGDGDVAICFSPDGKHLATGSWDKTIKIWDVSKGVISRRLIGHQQAIRTIKYSSDGKYIASAGWDNVIKIWYEATSVNLKNLYGHNQCIRSIDFSPDGQLLASGGYDLFLKLWDLSSGEEIFSVKGHKFPIESLVFHPSGKWIATAGLDNEIKVWNSENGNLERTIKGHSEGVYSIAFSHDGTYIASAGNDEVVKIWNFKSGTKVKEFSGHKQGVRSLSFSSDGKYLVSGGIDNLIKIWNVESLNIRPLNIITFHTESIDAITSKWLTPSELKDIMVFDENQTITISVDEPGLNKFNLYHNKSELRHYNGKDSVQIKPKSIKKYLEKIEISYDVKLKSGENVFQLFAENSEKHLYTISDELMLNYYKLEDQVKSTTLHLFVISPNSYSDKKWSYKPDDASKFTGLLKTQENKCYSKVIITHIFNASEASKEKIQSELLNIVNSCQKNDFVIIAITGLFLASANNTLYYIPPNTSSKEIEGQMIEVETICKSLLKMPCFTGLIIDASRKPSKLPDGYKTVEGKDLFVSLQAYLSYKKHCMIMTTDNNQPIKLYEQLANSFHFSNDIDGNKAIDLHEMSVFIRNLTLSQFFFRGELFPLYSHIN